MNVLNVTEKEDGSADVELTVSPEELAMVFNLGMEVLVERAIKDLSVNTGLVRKTDMS